MLEMECQPNNDPQLLRDHGNQSIIKQVGKIYSGGAPTRNQNAKTHGFYSKHMPAEAFEIMQDIQEFSPVDLLWEQIQIQFTAIVRAQKIIFVESKDRNDQRA